MNKENNNITIGQYEIDKLSEIREYFDNYITDRAKTGRDINIRAYEEENNRTVLKATSELDEYQYLQFLEHIKRLENRDFYKTIIENATKDNKDKPIPTINDCNDNNQ
jgi:hypothetical protein